MLNEIDRIKKSGVTKVNGTVFAVGLMWDPVDDPSHAMQEACNVAKSEGVSADFFCIRQSTPPQYGLGWKSAGHRAGMRSLAIAVTENVGSNFIGAFNLGDRWWFGMTKNDMIMPYGDAFYDTEEEAKEVMMKFSADIRGDFIKFAPASWNIDNSKETDLDVLITNFSKVKLASADSLLARYKDYLLLAAVLGIGGYMAFNHFDEKRQKAEKIRISREQQLEAAKKEIDPWKKMPEASVFIDNCSKAITSLPFNIFGWSINKVACDGKVITAFAEKSGGYIYDIEEKASQGELSLALSATGENAVLKKTLDKMDSRFKFATGEELLSGSKISQQFLDLKTKVGVDVKLSGVSLKEAQPRVMKDGDGNTVTLPPIYKPVKFSFKTKYPIEAWKKYLVSFPALSVNNVTLQIGRTLSWEISGNVYQK
ncbi:MAG: type 4b pilus protein PilO2 [Alphaproteobacteria bacterium]|jgi:hypothetical protein|nr:type 4b pilus protein PilO2 [Alphaproteobacteria bacterium]